MLQEWRCKVPLRQPERQQERCREQQRVKVIVLSAASFVAVPSCTCATKGIASARALLLTIQAYENGLLTWHMVT
jgi:hypothetical protein